MAQTKCSNAYPVDMTAAAATTRVSDAFENTSERNASAPPRASANPGGSSRMTLLQASRLRANTARAARRVAADTIPQVQNSATKHAGCKASHVGPVSASPFQASRMLSLYATKPPISKSSVWS